MKLAPGTRLRSAVCDTQVVVVRAPDGPVDLRCGGAPLVPLDDASAQGALDPTEAEGTLLGKRYADEDSGLELLCTKPGQGSLTCEGTRLPLKGAKPLPSSD
ncbi:MAG TPA: hypothetical protein VGO78_09825 [Acidimicrobiales bacterium]|jgi:hypothetical protein|nr:hypothetical protein [Acidimicrobiales bacterium]